MVVLQTVLNGLLTGGLYALIGIGMALVFGVMRIVNFAHGALIMVGMYAAYFAFTLLGLSPYLGWLLSALLLFALGWLLYRGLIRPVMGQSDFMQILLTTGIWLALVDLAQLAFGADYRQINLALANAVVHLGPLTLSDGYLLSFAAAVLVIGLVYAFLYRTEIGRDVRAVAQNREVAPLMGIDVERVSAVAFALGAACAGAGGALLLPLFYLYPTVGDPLLLRSFVMVVLGGMGSVEGAALGGLVLGVAESLTGYFWTDSYSQVVDFLLFLAVLLVRPSGLLGRQRA
ncbi:MAG: branched-chain amino acid ABC transporter permease [Clostridia bacterium]|nr:branched-chain amino acid ABC transporter permease [Clostridia bacterium]MCL6522666.1 branched-chain amino acid ABC transporter permease [Bacillota bacterium]